MFDILILGDVYLCCAVATRDSTAITHYHRSIAYGCLEALVIGAVYNLEGVATRGATYILYTT